MGMGMGGTAGVGPAGTPGRGGNPSGNKGPGGGTGGKKTDSTNPYDSRLKNKRYSAKKTKAYDATLANIAKLGGTILGGALAPGIGIGLGPIAADAMGMGYEGDAGTASSYGYDKGSATDDLPKPEGDNLAPAKPKKKKPKVTGLTLLQDAGGSLLGN